MFSVVILTNASMADTHLVSTVCWDSFVPLVVVKSYGFLGECRLQLREHDMIETKPDPELLHGVFGNPSLLFEVASKLPIEALAPRLRELRVLPEGSASWRAVYADHSTSRFDEQVPAGEYDFLFKTMHVGNSGVGKTGIQS